jgi:hypothetical protein
MPVILPESACDDWLDPSTSLDKATALLRPFDASQMKSYRVRPLINSGRLEGPDCIVPLAEPLPRPAKPRTPRPGDIVAVRPIFGGYSLPEALPEGTKVKLLSFDYGYWDVEYNGKKYRIFSSCCNDLPKPNTETRS